MAASRITKSTKRRIEELYNSGTPIHRIAQMFNITEHKVDKVLNRL